MRQTYALWYPLLSLEVPVFAGCCESLLRIGPSRRYSADLSPRVRTSIPAAPRVHAPVPSPRALAFPEKGPGRRFAKIPTAISVGSQISEL